MADKLTDQKEQIKNEMTLLETQKKRIQANETLSAQDKEQLKAINDNIKKEKERLVQIDRAITARKTEAREFESFAKSYRKLSGDVQKQLSGTSKGAGVYLSLGRQIAKDKAIQTKYAGSEKAGQKELVERAEQRQSKFEDISSELLNQAKATQKAEDKLRGVSDVDREILDIKESQGLYSAAQKAQMIAAIKQTEKLKQKEERLNTLAEERGNVLGALPGPIQDMVSGAQKFHKAMAAGAGPIVLIAAVAIAAIKSFIGLEEGAKKFREETGLTNSQMEGIRSQANQITQEFAETGLAAEDVFNTAAALTKEFTDFARFSNEVIAGLTLMNTNFGISTESAAKVQGIFEQIGGLSSETATSVGMQVANMARLAGVAPAKVFEDIAENAEIASTLFKGDIESLATAAIEARRLGTNLKSVASTTEHLLDFQSNIGDELVAATFVGGQFNLTQARSLAAAGKSIEAQEEVLRQLERGGKFRDKDYWTQRQLAKAAGMSVEEINKQLNAQEKLNSLSSEQRALADKAIEQGLDISNINKEDLASQVEAFSKQQEQQMVLEKISNQFTGIASTIGSVLVPVLDVVANLIGVILAPIIFINDMFGYVGEKISALIGPLGMVGKLIKGLAGLAIVYAAYKTFAAVSSGLALTGIGAIAAPIIGGAAAAAVLAAGFGALSKVGDLAIDPNGGPIVASPTEGALFQGTKNDGLMMAPGIGTSGIGTGGGVSERKIDELIAAVKQTKDVYMDGRRVTSNIGRAVDNSTKNNFSFGT